MVLRLLLVALADLLAPDYEPSDMEQQPDADHGQGGNGQSLVAGRVPGNGKDEPDGDEPHGAENQRFVGGGRGGPEFVQHRPSLPVPVARPALRPKTHK